MCIEGSFQDAVKVRELAAMSDLLTTEIEHVNVDVLEELENSGYVVRPSSKTIRIIQDKYQQKVHLAEHSLPLPEYMAVSSVEDAFEAGMKFGYPFVLKTRRLAYDGRGIVVVRGMDQLQAACDQLGGGDDLYAEEMVPFVKEIAVMVVRAANGVQCFPAVQTVQSDGICQLVIAPAAISTTAMDNAIRIATSAVCAFDGIGAYGVELFLLSDDSLLVNEVAPRPHNAGHWTMQGAEVDQFEMHLRAILDLPCPLPRMRVAAAMMVNILGPEDGHGRMAALRHTLITASAVPGATVHWYGKTDCRKGRKMAHVTVTASSMDELRERAEMLGIAQDRHGIPPRGPRVGIIMGSDSDLRIMSEAAEVLASFGVTYELTIVSAHRTPSRMVSYAQSAAERGLQVIIAGAGGAAHLPGMVAALAGLPVVGVPIRSAALQGQDSLLSIVQMPRGVPVATVAIDNATNAGLLAVRMLAAQDGELLRKMDAFMAQQEEEVLRKAAKLEAIGYKAYLENK